MKIFETMRIEQGVIPRVYYHTKRIRSSSAALGFYLTKQHGSRNLAAFKPLIIKVSIDSK